MERINLKFGIPGDRNSQPVWVPPTLVEVIDWIKQRPYDEEVKAALIQQASRYPGHALRSFVNNITKHVAAIHAKRRKEAE